MAKYWEVEHNGKVYEVEAESADEAAAAFAPQPSQQAPQQEPERYRGLGYSFGDKGAKMGYGERRVRMGINAVEAAYDMAIGGLTGVVAQPISGLFGLGAGAVEAVKGGDKNAVADVSARWQEGVSNFLTNDPESPLLGDVVGEAGQFFEKVVGLTPEQVAYRFDDGLLSIAQNNPEAATAMKTAILGVPTILGYGLGPMRPGALTSGRKAWTAARKAEDAGLAEKGLTADTRALPDKVRRKASEMAPDDRKGAGFTGIIDDVRAKKAERLQEVNSAWDEFRASNAGFQTAPFKRRAQAVRQDLLDDGFDIAMAPQVTRALQDLSRMSRKDVLRDKKIPGGRRQEAPFVEVEAIRRRVSRAIDDDQLKHGGQYSSNGRALLKVKHALDDEMHEQFIRGAMSGDPKAYAAWGNARGVSGRFARDFKTDKVINKMLEDGVTPEEVYKFMMGASAMNAKPQAVHTLRRLKEILGPENPAVQQIRQSALSDMLLPAFEDTPNFLKAARNIESALRNNPTLMTELGIDRGDMLQFARASRAAHVLAGAHPEKMDLRFIIGMGASIGAGHQIARKGALVRLIRKGANKAFGVGMIDAKDVRKILLGDGGKKPLLDYNPQAYSAWLAQSLAIEADEYAREERGE